MITVSNLTINQYQLHGGRVNDSIVLERCRQLKGPDKWAIRLFRLCLNKEGEWEWESPLGRDSAFLERCRFDSTEEALQCWLASEVREEFEGEQRELR